MQPHAGWDVAVSGDYVVSGCYGSTSVAGKVEFHERNPVDGSSTSSPWVFVASRSATSCSNPPSCTTQSDVAAAGDFFGYSVDISGSTAIVGSFGVNTNTGAAYIFERGFDTVFDGTTSNMWRLSKVLVAPDAGTNAFFGFSVALDGSYALVTSLKENDGKGYLFPQLWRPEQLGLRQGNLSACNRLCCPRIHWQCWCQAFCQLLVRREGYCSAEQR